MDLSILEDTVRIDLDIGTWIILFGGNLDLYWTFIPRCKGEEEYSFILCLKNIAYCSIYIVSV